MSKTYTVYQVDSFTHTKFQGNPAGVVLHADGLSDLQMQQIARELNNSETAFLFDDDVPTNKTSIPNGIPFQHKDIVKIRFFTPTHEVPICGHATIAAHYIRAKVLQLETCTIYQDTKAGLLPVDIIKEDKDYKIVMTQGEITYGSILTDPLKIELLDALHLTSGDLDKNCPIQIVSTGHSKVMIGIHQLDMLHQLKPDLSALSKLSKKINCNGYYVFSFAKPDESVLIHGRMFAPAIGIPEDPVTGNANGPLGAYLVHHHLVHPENNAFTFYARQGESILRPGTICVHVSLKDGTPITVKVSGHAVITFETGITITD